MLIEGKLGFLTPYIAVKSEKHIFYLFTYGPMAQFKWFIAQHKHAYVL